MVLLRITLRMFSCLFLACFLFSTLLLIAFKCWYILDEVFVFVVLACYYFVFINSVLVSISFHESV